MIAKTVRRVGLMRPLFQGSLVLWTVAVTIPLVVLVVGGREADEFISEHFDRPELEQQFGFRAERLPEWHGRKESTPFCVTAITPNGPFARAGVEVGDIPAAGFRHGNHASAFFRMLRFARGGRTYLVFYRGPRLEPVSVWISATDQSRGLPDN